MWENREGPGGYGTNVLFSTAVVVVEGLASLEHGSHEKRIFHGLDNSSAAVAQLELLPVAPRPPGIFVVLRNTETCSNPFSSSPAGPSHSHPPFFFLSTSHSAPALPLAAKAAAELPTKTVPPSLGETGVPLAEDGVEMA